MKRVSIALSMISLLIFATASSAINAQTQSDANVGNGSKSESGYSHDAHLEAIHPSWMAGIPDTTKISSISIPGTHDTMAFYGGDATQTQSLSLADQLNSGIRALDIRCRHKKDQFEINHGMVFQKSSFDEVMRTVTAFLKKNPTEVVLMRVREEYKPLGNTRSFEETFKSYHAKYSEFFWMPYGALTIPAIGTIRGKILVLQDFESSKSYGLKMADLDVQDNFHLVTNWALHRKWLEVRHQLAIADSGDRNKIYVNFLSGSGGAFPYFVASGKSSPETHAPRLLTGLTTPGWRKLYPDFPRVGCLGALCSIAFEGTNNLFTAEIKSTKYKYVGIIMADFPGAGLIGGIISLNKPDSE